ncbi:MAG: hypothetical protein OEM59_07275 [Rhodospirillales bacterium]|nr:hypothetical protein [Rhodospirillales bacterium]
MESPATNVNEVHPGRVYPASRPGIRFALCVGAAAIALIGYMIFG